MLLGAFVQGRCCSGVPGPTRVRDDAERVRVG
jgi:hypothetical protein